MTLFEEIINENELLNEITSNRDNDIKKAINNVLRVRISYDDKKKHPIKHEGQIIPPNKGKKERFILPVAYGLTKNGKRAIRAYQTTGSSKRGTPKWKLFLLDNIYSWSTGKKSFKQFGDTLIRLGLNTKGDKHMTTLFAITPIGGENVAVAKDSNPIAPTPITKNDVTPTAKLQSPETLKKSNEFVSSKEKQHTDIDIDNKNRYTNSKVNAPETEPVLKTDISPNYDSVANNDSVSEPQNTSYKTEPITKDDVNGTESVENNKLSNSFKDMTQRMDDLYQDNEDEEKNI